MVRSLVYSIALVCVSLSSAQGAFVGYRLDYRGDLEDDVNWSVYQLTNTSDSTELVRFAITIGDATHNWDAASFYAQTGPIAATLVTPDDLDDGVRSDDIVYEFSGFGPGEAYSFRGDVDPDSFDAILDFRSILFNNGGADNAIVTVDFSDGTQIVDVLADLSFASNTAAHLAGAAVPEPATLAIWSAMGCAGLCWGWRRRVRAYGSSLRPL